MSKYTTEVRFICETAAGLTDSEGYTSVNQILKAAVPSVFDFDFPIFDENYRSILETKILKHYYTREIGLETVGLWKLKLDTKLNEIMPFYNQLYKSELLEFNPLYDTDLERKHNLTKKETTKLTGTETSDANKTGNVTSSNTGNVDTTNKNTTTGTSRESILTDESGSVTQNGNTHTELHNTTGNTSDETATNTKTQYDKYADTPQGSLQNVINDTYLTNARMVTDTDTKTGKVTVTGNDDSTGTTTSDTTTDTNNSSDTTKQGNTSEDTNGTQNVKSTDTGNVNSTDVEKRNASQTTDKELSSLDDYIEYVKGKNGGASFSALLKEFRETFLNIDMMIIWELEELFMMLW